MKYGDNVAFPLCHWVGFILNIFNNDLGIWLLVFKLPFFFLIAMSQVSHLYS